MNEFNVTTGTVFTDCACVETASKASNTSLSSKWLVKDHLPEFSHPPPLAVIDEARRKFLEAGNPVTEAMAGWCEVPGCATNFKIFMGIVFLLSILGSTSRVGNVLVALRCVDIRDKALSFGLQVRSHHKAVCQEFLFLLCNTRLYQFPSWPCFPLQYFMEASLTTPVCCGKRQDLNYHFFGKR